MLERFVRVAFSLFALVAVIFISVQIALNFYGYSMLGFLGLLLSEFYLGLLFSIWVISIMLVWSIRYIVTGKTKFK